MSLGIDAAAGAGAVGPSLADLRFLTLPQYQ